MENSLNPWACVKRLTMMPLDGERHSDNLTSYFKEDLLWNIED
jgi:hypothetical protein